MRFNYDRLIALILLLFSVALYFFIIPWGVEGAGEGGAGLSPDFMPRWIAVVLASFSLLHLFAARGERKEVRLFHRRLLISIALFVLYIAITPLLGYLVASILIMAVYLLHFGVRRWHTIVLLSILFPVVLYLFFAKVMLVVLPKGAIFY